MSKRRLRQPLFVSLQTRPAEAVGTTGFAFYTPYFTPAPLLGAGVVYQATLKEGGPLMQQAQNGVTLSYGGLFAGTFAHQNLVKKSYIEDALK